MIRKTSDPRPSNIHTGRLLFKYLPYWPLFIVLFILSFCCAWIYLQLATPLYEVNARILINEKKGGDENKTEQPMDNLTPKKTIDNEREVIQSKPILYKVVDDLALYAPVYEAKRLGSSVAYHSSPVNIIAKSPNSIRESSKVNFSFSRGMVLIDQHTYPLKQWVKTPYGLLKFVPNPHFSGNATPQQLYFSLIPEKLVVASLDSRIKVTEANKLSTILNVVLLDEDADRGEAVLNDLLKVYNEAAIDEHNRLAANTSAFINQRLAAVEEELLSIESNLQNYRSQKGAVDVGTQGKLYLENVSTNDQKVGEINMQLSVLNQVEKYVRSKNLTGGIVPSTVGISDPGLTQMVKNIYELQLSAEGLRKTTGENNPLFVSYTDQIEKIKPQILQNLENQRNSLQASRNNLSSTTHTYSSALQSMPETERKLVDINRQQQIKSGIYTFLLQRKEENSLSYIANVSGNKIVNHAESSLYPVSPKRKMIYLASLLGAGIIGIGFVGVKEGLRTNIMFQKEIEQLTALPVIAEIAANESGEQIVMGTSRRTLIAEQFRGLRTTLNYLNIGKAKKRIMITSAISGEGKSFVASNLAMSLALTGKKVALLDFDLNNPTIHDKFNIPQSLGITDYLLGKAAVKDIIVQTKQCENLFVLLTGKLPFNPAELMLNGKAEELLRQLDTVFDYLILDVPPVGPVSDAYILAPFCDATLFVIRHAYTPKVFVERIDENIKLNNLPNAAIVFNSVSPRGYGKNTYGYGYGSGMVYGNKYDTKRLGTGGSNE